MEDLKKCVSESLDGFDTELFLHRPYMLQNLWSFGAAPKTIQKRITGHIFKNDLFVMYSIRKRLHELIVWHPEKNNNNHETLKKTLLIFIILA